MLHRAFIAAIFASALSFAACTPPEATDPKDGAEDSTGEQDESGSPSFSDGVITLTLMGGAAPVETTVPASECLIVNEGENGVVRGEGGQFELNWNAERGYNVIWDSGHGLYNGEVNGVLNNAEKKVTFEGSSGELTVSGQADCE